MTMHLHDVTQARECAGKAEIEIEMVAPGRSKARIKERNLHK